MLDTLLFIPHGHCYLWKTNLVRLHLISDALIGISYYSIPCTLFYFVQKRKDVPFISIFLLFVAFIVCCGSTHLMSIWTLWHPDYWVSGSIKAVTAGVSVYTALELIPVIPKALDLPSPAQLEQINQQLQQEVAERKQAEENLRRLSTRLNLAVESAAIGIWEWDVTRNAVIWDERMYQLYGLTPEQFSPVYEGWANQVHPDDRIAAETAVQQALQEEQDFDSEFRVIHPNGDIRFLQANALVQSNSQGEPQRMIGISYDVSDRKQDEAELRQYRNRLEQMVKTRTAELTAANQQLQQEITERQQIETSLKHQAKLLERSNNDLEQFAHVASHDLQEPLRTVILYSQLLAKRYANHPDPEADLFTTYIVDSAKQMQQLILDLLNYSRVGTNDKPFQPIECNQVLDQVLANLAIAIRQAGAVITFDPLPTVIAHKSQLVQLLQNLIGNAIKFRREDPPRIHISADRQPAENQDDEAEARPLAAPSETYWQFSVRDNGIGIEPKYSDRIFTIFQRLHSNKQYRGTGIGLAICKKIVNQLGGHIWVESEYGRGSTFYFTVPIRTSILSGG